MSNKIVIKTSIFPASKKEVFSRLKELKTLQYIAVPYATFTPDNNKNELIWEENSVFSFQFKLFGFIPLGIHTIKVISFNENSGMIGVEWKTLFVYLWAKAFYSHRQRKWLKLLARDET